MRLLLAFLGVISVAFAEDCWKTGCQPSTWAVRGCDQYDRDTRGTEPCPGGTKYNCCARGGGGGGAMPSWDEFRNAVTNNGYPAPSQDQYNNFVKHAGPKGQINTKQEAAMALAQFLHESDGLRAKREYACEKTNCPNSYRTENCDKPGQYYYGRGYIQLSWCGYNYRPASQDIFGDDRLVTNPDQVASDESTAWATAFWFWAKNVHNANGVQQGKFGASTKAINGALECGGSNKTGAETRFKLYGKVRQAFGLSGPGDSSGC